VSDYSVARRRMVEKYIEGTVRDPRVLEVMRSVPRHLFVDEALAAQAYGDAALPIGARQTISQPLTVAVMTEALALTGDEKVLEIGTGSGYQTAVLARLAERVYSIERIVDLARKARKVLDQLACRNANLRIDDGTIGWSEEAPFDAIIVTAGAPSVPQEYLDQLAPSGRLVIPVGDRDGQRLQRITRKLDGRFFEEDLGSFRFVPLIGSHGWQEG